MHRPGKKITFAIVIIVLLLIGIYASLLNPSVAQSLREIRSTTCNIGNWQQFDMPELADEWQGQLESVGLEATDISAYGVGESTECVGYTLLGTIHKSYPPSSPAHTSVVYATIRVDSLSDDAALGEIVIKVLAALAPVAGYYSSDLGSADVNLSFIVAGQSRSIEFYPGSANEWRRLGLTSAELFQALDGRRAPPTVTPLPPKD